MNRLFALFVLAMGVGVAPALAQRTIIAIAEDFATVCGGGMTDVEAAAKEAVRLGYGQIERSNVNKVSRAISINGPRGGFVFTDQVFTDMTNFTCTHTIMGTLTVSDIEALAARFSKVRGVGPLEGGAGSPDAGGNVRSMIFGTYKRPGNDPQVTVNSLSTPQFSNISVTVVRLTPKN